MNNIACVTGATGMVGSRIVKQLLIQGYQVRILTRRVDYDDDKVEIFRGGLEDEDVLKRFLKSAGLLFHCAAELKDESKMWEVNVQGTERLINIVTDLNIKYFCYLSSVGVTGISQLKMVDETSKCTPQNIYEKSKWAAEQLVKCPITGCNTVILRPTNVIDEKNPGTLLLPIKKSWLNRFKVFVKGGECAHIIHAEDVAAVALFLVTYPCDSPQCFIVSNDDEPLNTFGGIWALYRSLESGCEEAQTTFHLPIIIPYLFRIIYRGKGNMGNVRYSARKLFATGFSFPLGLKATVKQMVLSKEANKY